MTRRKLEHLRAQHDALGAKYGRQRAPQAQIENVRPQVLLTLDEEVARRLQISQSLPEPLPNVSSLKNQPVVQSKCTAGVNFGVETQQSWHTKHEHRFPPTVHASSSELVIQQETTKRSSGIQPNLIDWCKASSSQDIIDISDGEDGDAKGKDGQRQKTIIHLGVIEID